MKTRDTTRGFGISSIVGHGIVRELAPAAEAAGFRMFWVNDLPGSSGLASLGVAAKAAALIEMGVGVLAVDRWDVDDIAKEIQVAGIDLARLTIGIGAGRLTVGSRSAVRGAAVGLLELGVRRVVIGSLGPNLTRIGGSDADGVLLNWVTPEAAHELASLARDGATASDREGWTATYTRVASDETARRRLVAECEAYESYPAYARHFARFGVGAMDTSILGDRDHIARWLARYDGIVDHVVVRAIAASETLEDYLAVLRYAAPVATADPT